jgi:hypothetical protein
MSKSKKPSSKLPNRPSSVSPGATIAKLPELHRAAMEVVAAGNCTDEDVKTVFAVRDQIIARPDDSDECYLLKMQVVVPQLRTACEQASDGKLWDQLMDLIDALSGTAGMPRLRPAT